MDDTTINAPEKDSSTDNTGESITPTMTEVNLLPSKTSAGFLTLPIELRHMSYEAMLSSADVVLIVDFPPGPHMSPFESIGPTMETYKYILPSNLLNVLNSSKRVYKDFTAFLSTPMPIKNQAYANPLPIKKTILNTSPGCPVTDRPRILSWINTWAQAASALGKHHTRSISNLQIQYLLTNNPQGFRYRSSYSYPMLARREFADRYILGYAKDEWSSKVARLTAIRVTTLTPRAPRFRGRLGRWDVERDFAYPPNATFVCCDERRSVLD